MDDTGAVCRGECIGDLNSRTQQVLEPHPFLARNQLLERFPLDMLHDDAA
jgi:hypothetical protein